MKTTNFVLIQIVLLLVALLNSSTLVAQTNDSLLWQGVRRTFTVYLPSDYNPTQLYPLLIAMHPGLSNATQHAESTQWHTLGEREKFITVYPNGMPSTPASNTRLWNAYNQPSAVSQYDDVGFLNAMLDHLIRQYRIDTCRIFASGFSNGAMMTYRMACDATRRFAAIAPLSGGWGYGSDGFCDDGNCNGDPAGTCGWSMSFVNCRPARRIAVVFMKGSREGDNLPTCRGTTDSLNKVYWRTFLNCRQVRIDTVSRSNERVIREVFSPCQDGTEFQFLTVIGNSHQWHASAVSMFWEFLKRFTVCGIQQPTSVDIQEENVSSSVSLQPSMSIAPNPVDGKAFVSLHLSKQETVAIEVFSMMGVHIATLLTPQELSSGIHTIPLHAEHLASGVYYCRLRLRNGIQVVKFVVPR